MFNIGDGVVRGIEVRANPDDFIVDIFNLLLGQGSIPDLNLIDDTREMCTARTIDTEFVEFNTVDCAVGNTLVEYLDTIQIQGHSVVDEGGDKVLPNGWVDGTETV